MSPESDADVPIPGDDTIFVAEGILSERLDVPIDEAISVLADLAVGRGRSLLETAQDIVEETTRHRPHRWRDTSNRGHTSDPRGDRTGSADVSPDGRPPAC
jgi:hypothetical protein